MGRIARHTAAELRRLPLTLAKLLGGAMTGIGVATAVFLGARKPDVGTVDIAPYVLLGIAGLAVFILASRALAKRACDGRHDVPAGKNSSRLNALSWMLLLLFAALFLCIVLFLTR